VGLPRTVFSQAALYEIGSAITVFMVRKHRSEFLAALESQDPSIDAVATAIEQINDEGPEEDSNDEPRASRIERHTRDFVLEALQRNLTHQEFEEFTAALLRALGYQARVTQ